MILRPGQYCILSSYKELYREVLDELFSGGREVESERLSVIQGRLWWLDELVKTFAEFSEDVLVAFYRPLSPSNSLAVKVEVYPSKS